MVQYPWPFQKNQATSAATQQLPEKIQTNRPIQQDAKGRHNDETAPIWSPPEKKPLACI